MGWKFNITWAYPATRIFWSLGRRGGFMVSALISGLSGHCVWALGRDITPSVFITPKGSSWINIIIIDNEEAFSSQNTQKNNFWAPNGSRTHDLPDTGWASNRYLEGHGFNSRWGLKILFLSISTWERFFIFYTLSKSPIHLSLSLSLFLGKTLFCQSTALFPSI